MFGNKKLTLVVGATLATSIVTVGSAEARVIAYTNYNGSKAAAYAVDENGKNERLLRRGNVGTAVSPDGNWIATSGGLDFNGSRNKGTTSVDIWPAVGGQPINLFKQHKSGKKSVIAGAQAPVWSPDGKRVAFVTATTKLSSYYGYARAEERVVCEVATRSCVNAGKRSKRPFTNFIGWDAASGLVELTENWDSSNELRVPRTFSCKSRKSFRIAGTSSTLSPVSPNASFPGAIKLSRASDAVNPSQVSAATGGDGVLMADYPADYVKAVKLRCTKKRISARFHSHRGPARLRVQRGGKLETISLPAEIRADHRLTLVSNADGGALVVAKRAAPDRSRGTASRKTGRFNSFSSYGSGTATSVSVWRYTPGATTLAPVVKLRRSVAEQLNYGEIQSATNDRLIVNNGNAVLIPLDGGGAVIL